jgi:hypothetical protein
MQQMTNDAWELDPFTSIGPLRFDMDRTEVVRVLGEEPESLPTPPGLPTPPVSTETFNAAGVHVEYDPDGRLLSVEAFDRTVQYRGIAVNDRDVEEVTAELRAEGVTVVDDPAGPDAWDIGLRLTVEPEGEVSGAMAVRRDYREVVSL